MKKLTLGLGAAVFFSGCAVGPTTGTCIDPPITRINIVFVKNSEIKVSSPNIRTEPGNILRFKLTGASSDTVNIKGKNTASAWIDGTGSGGSYIDVCVDSSQADATYQYEITIPTVGYLDPEVTVRR